MARRRGAFNFRPAVPIALLLLSLRRAWCVLRAFEWRLNSPTRGRVGWRLKVSNADVPVCARGLAACAHLKGDILPSTPSPVARDGEEARGGK